MGNLRKSSVKTPVVISGLLYTEDEYSGIRVSSAEWFAWLLLGSSFYVDLRGDGFTVRAEKRRQGFSWYAFKRRDGHLKKVYVGRVQSVTLERFDEIGEKLRNRREYGRDVPDWIDLDKQGEG